MVKVNVAALKSELSKYLEIAQGGEQVVVTSHGQEVARIVAPRPVLTPPVNWKEFFRKYPPVKAKWKGDSAAELIRKIRDEE